MNSLSLGIPGVEDASPGTHFCALYVVPAQRDRLSFSVLEEGLRHEFEFLQVAGEPSWVLPGPPGWDDLFLYETVVNHAAEQVPGIFMCLYDLQKFGAGTLVKVLFSHPSVLLDRTMVDNAHCVQPMGYAPPVGGAGTVEFPMVKVAANDTEGDHGWASITNAELRIVSCVARGMSNRSIAEELYLSHHTVDAHLKHVYLKLGIHSRVELTVLTLQHG